MSNNPKSDAERFDLLQKITHETAKGFMGHQMQTNETFGNHREAIEKLQGQVVAQSKQLNDALRLLQRTMERVEQLETQLNQRNGDSGDYWKQGEAPPWEMDDD